MRRSELKTQKGRGPFPQRRGWLLWAEEGEWVLEVGRAANRCPHTQLRTQFAE